MPCIDEQMAVQAVLAPSASLSLSHSSGSNSGARWLTTCRLQTLHTRAQFPIGRNWSAGLLSALPSTLKKPPCSLCKAEGHCGRSKVLLLSVMEQLLIFQPNPPFNTYLYFTKGISFLLSITYVDSHRVTERLRPKGQNIRIAGWLLDSLQCRGVQRVRETPASPQSYKRSNERNMKGTLIRYTIL